jgi:hypothetical protein
MASHRLPLLEATVLSEWILRGDRAAVGVSRLDLAAG